MDWLTFFSKVIESLVWPLTFFTTIFYIVQNGPKIKGLVKTIKYKEVSIEFQEALSEARKEASDANILLSPEKLKNPSESDEEIKKIAVIDSSLAVIEIWRRLEIYLLNIVQSAGIEWHLAPAQIMQFLHKDKKIDEHELKLFFKLRELRNLATHTLDRPTISIQEVMEYKLFADKLTLKLDSIQQPLANYKLPKNVILLKTGKNVLTQIRDNDNE